MGPHRPPWAHGPMGPMALWVPMGPMAHGPNGLSLGPAWPEKSMLPGPQGAQKTEIYKKSCDPGLNHEPWVVFYAEFEFGIENSQNLAKNTKYQHFSKL